MIGLGLSLLAGRRGGAASLPSYIGYGGATAGNPATPAGAVGDLLVAFGPRASSTPPTADAAWTLWGTEAHPGIALSLAFYYKIATGTAAGDDPITWTSASSMRGTWRFTNAAIDTLNFSNNGVGGATTALNWEAQPAMAAQSLVGIGLVGNIAQTNTGAALGGAGTTLANAGFVQRGQRSASLPGWSGDSDTTRLSAFDPADSTFDTATNWIAAVFSVKAP